MTPERPVAIVTGGARGIGRASAVALARRGFAVAMVDQREAELQERASRSEPPAWTPSRWSGTWRTSRGPRS